MISKEHIQEITTQIIDSANPEKIILFESYACMRRKNQPKIVTLTF